MQGTAIVGERKLLNSFIMCANNVSPYPEGYYYTVRVSANVEREHGETHLVGLCW